MRRAVLLAFGFVVASVAVGCGDSGKKTASNPLEPKWKGLPYRIAFDAGPAKGAPAGVVLPGIKYTANPEMLESRAVLVIKFEVPGEAYAAQPLRRMIGNPVDLHGAEGTLPADYVDRASKGLSEYLASYCIQGKISVSVALARSSLNPQAALAEVDAKRLSDWVPTDVVAKKPKGKCQQMKP